MQPRLALLTCASLFCACGVPEDITENDSTLMTQRQAVQVSNGREVNGREVNGREVNGREVNGREVNGPLVNGVFLSTSLSGLGLVKVKLDGTQLSVTTFYGKVLTGSALTGTVLLGDSEDGLMPLRIDSAALHAKGSSIWDYSVSAWTGKRWEPLCGTDEKGAPLRATALSGVWDYRQGVPGGGSKTSDASRFTFACQRFALYKCTEFGYEPWTSAELDQGHQACVRMLRADYCGDGRSFTVDGTVVNIYDRWGILEDTDRWDFEAEWDADGARCLSTPRIRKADLPLCADQLQKDKDCGKRFSKRTLLMSEVAPSSSSAK